MVFEEFISMDFFGLIEMLLCGIGRKLFGGVGWKRDFEKYNEYSILSIFFYSMV